MSLYAELPAYRARQIVGDAAVILWTALWIKVGMWITELLDRLAGPGRAVERAGLDFARPLADAGRRVADVPLVGDALQNPLAAAARGGRVLAQAGSDQQQVVHTLAVWLGVVVAIVPISLLALMYVPGRVRWLREAHAARRLRAGARDLELFAMRAVATKPLGELHRVSKDPAGDLRAGRFEHLAALELRTLGLSEKNAAPEAL
jgi:hypothetical protein